jgi:hypothetical protein
VRGIVGGGAKDLRVQLGRLKLRVLREYAEYDAIQKTGDAKVFS